MKGIFYIKAFIVACLIGLVAPAMAQGSSDQVKSLFVFNFTRYIQWPQTSSEITIGVLGNDANIIAAFNKMAEKKSAGNAKIVVKQFNNPAEAGSYHMVYIPESNSAALKQIKGLTNTLVITEKPGLAKEGSYINFITDNGKIRFEINKQEIDNSKLKVSGQLLSLAILV